jgi:hypothetical protein
MSNYHDSARCARLYDSAEGNRSVDVAFYRVFMFPSISIKFNPAFRSSH